MFTGLIEEVGTVAAFDKRSGSSRMRVNAPRLARELKTGDSISVSGVCLTAVEIGRDHFKADLAAETIARTSLARLQPGSPVNLELPPRPPARMGGHIVQGHVDGTGKLLSLVPLPMGGGYWMTVEIPRELTRYVVEKGSITIEGISLTVAGVSENCVSVAVIPHTYDATNLHALVAGDPVNIEVDVAAKYAEKQLASKTSSVTLEDLLRQGF